jgi:hypothetical protein
MDDAAPERRAAAADVLPWLPDIDARTILAARSAVESEGGVLRRIRWALETIEARETDPLPPLPSLTTPALDAPLDITMGLRLLTAKRRELREMREQLSESAYKRYAERDAADESTVREWTAYLAGQASQAPRRIPFRAWDVAREAEMAIIHVARAVQFDIRERYGEGLRDRIHPNRLGAGAHAFGAWFATHDGNPSDLRQVQAVADHLRWPRCTVERTLLDYEEFRPLYLQAVPSAGIWPWYAEHPCVLWRRIVQDPADERAAPDWPRVLDVLQHFPTVPAELRGPLFELALGTAATHRASAQRVLGRTSGIAGRVAEHLQHTKTKAERIVAARWLGDLGEATGADVLLREARRETRPDVLATLLDSVRRLGANLGEALTAQRLLADAEKGLRTRPPAAIGWLDEDRLPSRLQWRDGGEVPAGVPRWWVRLAAKLKDPGNSLLLAYLDTLEPASAASFGLWVLEAFLEEDVRPPNDFELGAWVERELHERMRWTPCATSPAPAGELRAALRHELAARPVGSAMKAKGILALCARVRWRDAAPVVERFLREHHARWKQVAAIVEALSASEDPEVIQWLMRLARGYRTRAVRELAADRVAAIGARRGWSAEQLADRTLPACGFEDSGTLLLSYGPRQFRLTLDARAALVLLDADGRTIPRLPKPRRDDDDQTAREAAALLKETRKAVRDVLQTVTQRFYEAMCGERRWNIDEWQEYILAHPLAGRLARRLLWEDDDGELFLPGTPRAEDATERTESVRLAHGSRLSEGEREAWQARFLREGVDALFEQLARVPVAAHFGPDDREITAFRGYLTDNLRLKAGAMGLGYRRGPAEDGGAFYSYRREFAFVPLTAVIEFSGSYLPEKKTTVALGALRFIRAGRSLETPVRLRDVPPVLLSEALAQLRTLAAASDGFDPRWERKVGY